ATGCFVALEGGEGAGKSTQARLLEEWLTAEGYAVLLTHEPGDTEAGQKLRGIVPDPATGDISHRTEAPPYAADTAEHGARGVTVSRASSSSSPSGSARGTCGSPPPPRSTTWSSTPDCRSTTSRSASANACCRCSTTPSGPCRSSPR